MIAEVHFAAGRLEEAARFNALGLDKARATSSTKYEVSALSLRAKLRSGHEKKETPEKDFGQAMALARTLQSPTILLPIAHDFGTWCESAGNEASAAAIYGEAKSAVDAISSSIPKRPPSLRVRSLDGREGGARTLSAARTRSRK